jgi:hypothetical protein
VGQELEGAVLELELFADAGNGDSAPVDIREPHVPGDIYWLA